MKNRYFIRLSFKGTHYHGWQIQHNATTVQGILNRDLSIVLGEKIETTGAGRTDTGVHVKVFYAHFDSEKDNLQKDTNLVFRINGKLSKDIAVHEILKVKDDAHARYDAINRTYEYHITRVKNPFLTEFAHYIYGELDFEAMKTASALLLNVSDFTSFSKVDTDVKTNICKVSRADWEIDKEKIVFTITADRFLRDMVRAIVGTMLDIGYGRLKPEDLTVIINKKDRSAAGASVPAKGLFLTDVQYPAEIFI
ncbi:MAG: pseudouridine synthase [Bacteroides sp. SM23_62_1]|nr:MAG: pseudouridine synthase [Bacteroides sp. SM23_62_1]